LFEVNIKEPIVAQLTGLTSAVMPEHGKSFVYSGKFIEKEDTCLSLSLKEKAKLLAPQEAGTMRMEPIMWYRTTKISTQWTDYTNVHDNSWDALRFKPKRPVWFLGFGSLKNFDAKFFAFEVKYRVS